MGIYEDVFALKEKIEAEKAAAVAAAERKATEEKIIPYNIELDDAYQKARIEIDEKLGSDLEVCRKECEDKIAKLTEAAEAKKEKLFAMGETKKAEYAKRIMVEEDARVAARYNPAIEELVAMANRYKEDKAQ